MVSRKLVGFVLLVATPFLLLGFASAWVKHQELVRRYQLLETENRVLEVENQKTQELLQQLSLDTVKELEIRRRFNYTKPGERLVVFLSPSPVPTPTPVQKDFWERLNSFFQRD